MLIFYAPVLLALTTILSVGILKRVGLPGVH